MKKLTLFLFLLAMHVGAWANESRIVESLNFGWQFHAGDIVDGESLSLDDSGWQTINVPHDFQIHQPWVAPSKDEKADNSDIGANVRSRLSSRAFKEMGIAWYRKTITPDASWKGKRIIIDFEGIMLVGDVYINGKYAGGTDYGYLGFEIDATKLLKFGEKNVIAVKANTMNPDNSRWYTGGGLFRDVNVIVTDAQQHFTRHPLYITTPLVGTDKSVVKIQAELGCYLRTNKLNINTTIIAQNGDTVYNKTKEIPFNRGQKVNEHKIDSITIEKPIL